MLPIQLPLKLPLGVSLDLSLNLSLDLSLDLSLNLSLKLSKTSKILSPRAPVGAKKLEVRFDSGFAVGVRFSTLNTLLIGTWLRLGGLYLGGFGTD